MKEHDYTIAALSSTFARHSDTAQKQAEKQLAEFKEVYVDSPLPEHLEENFNIARALSVICCEIEKLQHKVGK